MIDADKIQFDFKHVHSHASRQGLEFILGSIGLQRPLLRELSTPGRILTGDSHSVVVAANQEGG